jgi:hypothetical protein
MMKTDQILQSTQTGLDLTFKDSEEEEQPRETLEQILAKGRKENLLLNPRQYQVSSPFD